MKLINQKQEYLRPVIVKIENCFKTRYNNIFDKNINPDDFVDEISMEFYNIIFDWLTVK